VPGIQFLRGQAALGLVTPALPLPPQLPLGPLRLTCQAAGSIIQSGRGASFNIQWPSAQCPHHAGVPGMAWLERRAQRWANRPQQAIPAGSAKCGQQPSLKAGAPDALAAAVVAPGSSSRQQPALWEFGPGERLWGSVDSAPAPRALRCDRPRSVEAYCCGPGQKRTSNGGLARDRCHEELCGWTG